jgi:hypothetical protein
MSKSVRLAEKSLLGIKKRISCLSVIYYARNMCRSDKYLPRYAQAAGRSTNRHTSSREVPDMRDFANSCPERVKSGKLRAHLFTRPA